jgi:arylsulfatase A-like enzyme
MTGRYPITIGMQYEELQTDVNWGLNLTEILLPEVLRDNGNYKNYALGKWNLGHFTPKLLPTARGFHEYLGYLAGQNYYWSKHMPNQDDYQDFTVSNSQCFNAYNGSDLEDYSTFLYRDKAIKAIKHHDFNANPMFMYLAFQAVHDPFDDINKYEDGLPPSYLGEELYGKFVEAIPGRNRQQYAMALKLMDQAVESIVNALIEAKQMDNTYIIFASDNGGCYQAGGRNGNLRGTKGSLWEGKNISVNIFSVWLILLSSQAA